MPTTTFTILGVLLTLAAFPLPAAASGDPPKYTANRFDDPRVLIKDIRVAHLRVDVEQIVVGVEFAVGWL